MPSAALGSSSSQLQAVRQLDALARRLGRATADHGFAHAVLEEAVEQHLDAPAALPFAQYGGAGRRSAPESRGCCSGRSWFPREAGPAGRRTRDR